MTDEPRMTRAEWQREANLRECATHGHSLHHITSGDGSLLKVICDCCGKSWKVVEE